MPDFSNILDKYDGEDICKMTTPDRNAFFSAIATNGAIIALKTAGLDDDQAIKDMRDMRTLLRGWRVARVTVASEFWRELWKILKAALIIWLLLILFPQEKAKEIIRILAGGG
jgi:hypothetical protein